MQMNALFIPLTPLESGLVWQVMSPKDRDMQHRLGHQVQASHIAAHCCASQSWHDALVSVGPE
jgi:hypothetical protein